MTQHTSDVITALQRKLSNGKLDQYARANIANLIGQLKHLQAPLNAIHQARLRQLMQRTIAMIGNTAQPGRDEGKLT